MIEAELRNDLRYATIPIMCLLIMAIVPPILYYQSMQSAFGGEPRFLLGSYPAFAIASVVWFVSAVLLTILLVIRMRFHENRPIKEGVLLALTFLSMLEVVVVAIALIVFALNLLGTIESDAVAYIFCLAPTATLVFGGIVLIEGRRLTNTMGRMVWRLSYVLVMISVPWALFIGILGFVGTGMAS